jgi:hypothetical protein
MPAKRDNAELNEPKQPEILDEKRQFQPMIAGQGICSRLFRCNFPERDGIK